jgi:raffinose/stachyose/melibiose transport system permease protein
MLFQFRNDIYGFLLPYLLLGSDKGKTTLPVAIQIANQGGYGDNNMGAFMAMIVLSLIPVILFYLVGQKYIIKGVTAGAVKG